MHSLFSGLAWCLFACASANPLFPLEATNKRGHVMASKRDGVCEPYEPFQCPEGDCIPIKFLCDGTPDCSDMYDEDEKMCSALRRPPLLTTQHLLMALLKAHGENFLVSVFGPMAGDSFAKMGGVHNVAVALTEFPNLKAFASHFGIIGADAGIIATNMKAIAGGDGGDLGLSGREAADLKFYINKLVETGFLDE